jgi:hypothetical protein
MQAEKFSGDCSALIQAGLHLVPNATGLRLMDEAIEAEAEVISVLLLAFDAQLRAQVEAIKEFILAFDAQFGEVPSRRGRIERLEERIERLEERAELILRCSANLGVTSKQVEERVMVPSPEGRRQIGHQGDANSEES